MSSHCVFSRLLFSIEAVHNFSELTFGLQSFLVFTLKAGLSVPNVCHAYNIRVHYYLKINFITTYSSNVQIMHFQCISFSI